MRVGTHRDTKPVFSIEVYNETSATGLEAPIVFLPGIDSLLEKEQAPFLPDDEKQELQQTHTQQIYMAITRAGQRLVIFSKNQQIHAMLTGCVHATKVPRR